MSMKAEMEMAMKLLEKDVHEKQDTIISLREQLDDIKNINLEMYVKLQVRRNVNIVSKVRALIVEAMETDWPGFFCTLTC